jgi:hypothetical protein
MSWQRSRYLLIVKQQTPVLGCLSIYNPFVIQQAFRQFRKIMEQFLLILRLRAIATQKNPDPLSGFGSRHLLSIRYKPQ